MLSVVENLKQFCTILLGHNITVYMDHKNITYNDYTTEKVILLCFLLEEYSLTIIYLKGPDIYTEYTLRRLPCVGFDLTQINITR